MSIELTYLVWIAAICAVLWVPYVLVRAQKLGLTGALGYPKPQDLGDFARRAERAHMNLVENLAVFAALVLAAEITNTRTELTMWGATLFFWARIVHIPVMWLGIPYLRTLVFVVSWVGLALIFIELAF
jgi:uncharacterized MAPEG superfamily protein